MVEVRIKPNAQKDFHRLRKSVRREYNAFNQIGRVNILNVEGEWVSVRYDG